MKLLVLGAWCSCNLGDSVICRCVEARLRDRFPQAQIILADLVSRDRTEDHPEPELKMLKERRIRTSIRRIASRVGVDLCLRREKRRIEENRAHLEALCSGDYDAVIFAGGQMFMEGYALFLSFCVERFSARGIPVFFNACGTGPMNSRAITRALTAALADPVVKYISCRDGLQTVAAWLPQTPVHPGADPAMAAGKLLNISRNSGDKVGLGVLYPNGFSEGEAIRFWQKVIRRLEEEKIPWQMFSNGDPADVIFARLVIESMPELAGRQDLIRCRDREPEDLVKTLAGYRSLISFRLHSHIIAASMGIPSVAVVWDAKLPAFFEKLGYPQRCLTLKASPEQVCKALFQAEKEGYATPVEALADASAAELIRALEAYL